MQANREITSSPISSSDSQDELAETVAKINDEFSWKVTLDSSHGEKTEKAPQSDEEAGDDDEDFSFACIGADASPIYADDVFQNGQIKLDFPLFDQSLLFAGDSVNLKDDLPRRPAVKKVFVEARESCSTTTEEGTGRVEGQAAGPFCSWSGKAVEASPEICKKSNSTGFSKLWRFGDLLNRSNSDGRDAFVFLNGSTTANSKRDDKVDRRESTSEKKTAGDAKGNAAGRKLKAKKEGNVETALLSAHESHYVRNRALREKNRRRSFLPYRPELVGFFTNVHGGLSRNVHPF